MTRFRIRHSSDAKTSARKLSTKNSYAILYYLYRISCELDFKDFEEYEGHFCNLFCSLVDSLHKKTIAKKILSEKIKLLIKQKQLTPISLEESQSFRFNFDNTDMHFAEDKIIANRYMRHVSKSEISINLCRCVLNEKNILPEIISQVFFEDCCDDDEQIENALSNIEQYEKDFSQIEFLTDALKFSEDETHLLMVAYRIHTITELMAFCYEVYGSDNIVKAYAICMNVSEQKIRTLLRKDKKLVSFGFIDTDGEIASDTLLCIADANLDIYFSDLLKEGDLSDAFNLKSFSVPEKDTELCTTILNCDSPTNILLYGSPGSGKTEFAKALAKKSRLRPLIFKNEAELDGTKGKDNFLYKLNCLLSIKKEDSVIIVDEAESVLATQMNLFMFMFNSSSSSKQKGTVNKMLEENVNKVIWIVNYTDAIDESTRRRFTYSVRFNDMPEAMLRSIADSKLSQIKMSNTLHNELLDLCGKYHITGASVDNVVKTVRGMDCTQESKVASDVKNLLEANSTLLYGKAKMRETVNSSYDVNILNTSTDANEIVSMVENAMQFAENNPDSPTGIRMLFYGLSGTGKTELARYIAQKLNKKILLKRASDILGKYVGENEANIRAAFTEAEANGNILLFDEADSFFADRNSAERSWERTMVNEFLTQMDEFSGILICTTNLRNIMDAAMQRRFHIIAEFKPLTKNGIKTLLEKYFATCTFSENQIAMLLRYDSVTPGDFSSLAGKVRFMSPEKITADYISSELMKIQDEKCGNGKRIGFVA